MENTPAPSGVTSPASGKKVAKIIGIAVVAFLVILAAVFYFVFNMTSGLVDTFDEFYTNLEATEYQTSYETLATSVKNKVSFDEYIDYLENNEALFITAYDWQSRVIEGDFGYLIGTASMLDGSVITYRVNFIKEGDSWKIVGFEPDYIDNGNNNPVTQNKEVQKTEDLVQDTMELFYGAIETEDFSAFHQSLSQIWKEEVTAEELGEAFNVYYDKLFLLEPINEVSVEIISENISEEDNVEYMVVELEYPGTDYTVNAELEYAKLISGYKLISIYVNSE